MVFLGLGANLGEPVLQLARAIQRLEGVVDHLVVSSVYRSGPVGYAGQPDFYNLVAAGDTHLTPRELLAHGQAVEQALGRTRPFPNAPRTLDLDLLAYDDLLLATPELTLPHPRLHQRAFVLVPLVEVAPEWVHPVFQRTARELLESAGPLERIERIGRLPGW